jgi:hypothetical protein
MPPHSTDQRDFPKMTRCRRGLQYLRNVGAVEIAFLRGARGSPCSNHPSKTECRIPYHFVIWRWELYRHHLASSSFRDKFDEIAHLPYQDAHGRQGMEVPYPSRRTDDGVTFVQRTIWLRRQGFPKRRTATWPRVNVGIHLKLTIAE